MKKRVLKVLLTGCIMGLFLTGCGNQFPEMTDEEYDQVVQYAVSVLMKYSNNGVEKLSSLSSLELEKQMRKEAREAEKAARDAKTAEKVANMSDNPEEQESDDSNDEIKIDETQDETNLALNDDEPLDDTSNTEPAPDETGNTDASQDGKSESSDDVDELLEKFGDDLDEGIKNAGIDTDTKPEETEKPEEISEDNTDDTQSDLTVADNTESGELTTEADKAVEGMRQELSKGIFLTYSGYSVAGAYPDNDDIFVINATAGKKLLILNFRLANTSGMDVAVDMVKANPHFQVLLNGVNVGYTNVTMLDNDLSSYKGTIPAGAKLSMVLIKQMDAEKVKNVSSLGIIGDMGSETIQFNLE